MIVVVLILLCLGAAAQDCKNAFKTPKIAKCGKSELKYYYDDEHKACYPFTATGCEQPSTVFASYTNCIHACFMLDGVHCVVGDSTGSCYTPPERPPPPPGVKPPPAPAGEKCPAGSTCHPNPTGEPGWGYCCDTKKEAEYPLDLEQCEKLKKGKTWKTKSDGYESVVVGKSCAHKFCGKGTTCVQGKHVATCCKK